MKLIKLDADVFLDLPDERLIMDVRQGDPTGWDHVTPAMELS